MQPSQSPCGSDAKSEPDTPTKGQYSTSFHKTPQRSLLPSYICLCFNGQLKKKNKKRHTFSYYQIIQFTKNVSIYIILRFFKSILPCTFYRNLKSEDHLCWCYALLLSTNGWEPSMEKKIDLHSQVKINCLLGRTPVLIVMIFPM